MSKSAFWGEIELNDPLNLRDFICHLNGYIKSFGSKHSEPRTIVSFLEMAFSGIYPSKDDSAIIKDIQRLFSGNIQPAKIMYIVNDLATENIPQMKYTEKMTRFRENLDSISLAIQGCEKLSNHTTDFVSFSDYILKKIDRRFFTRVEMERIQHVDTTESYTDLLLLLTQHGLQTLNNLPCFFAQRTYEEALTYSTNNRLRVLLMKIAADNGNKPASLEYSSYISTHITIHGENSPFTQEEVFEYTLMAFPIDAALWNMAFYLEHRPMSETQLDQLKSVLQIEKKLSDHSFDQYRYELELVSFPPNGDPHKRECLILAYKICFYLAYKGFSKAFNSLGRYCSNKFVHEKRVISVANSQEYGDSEQLSLYYLEKATRLGSLMGAISTGSTLLKKYQSDDLEESDIPYMLQLLRLSTDSGMNRGYQNLTNYFDKCENTEKDALKKAYFTSEKEKYREAAISADTDFFNLL